MKKGQAEPLPSGIIFIGLLIFAALVLAVLFLVFSGQLDKIGEGLMGWLK